jgi:hypothetical protein
LRRLQWRRRWPLRAAPSAHADPRDFVATEPTFARLAAARRAGACALRREFGGDGRAAAAGIIHLPPDELPEFVRRIGLAFA